MKKLNNIKPMVEYKQIKSNVIKHICFFCLFFIFFVGLGSCQTKSDTCKCDGIDIWGDGISIPTDSLYCKDTIIFVDRNNVIYQKYYIQDCFGTLTKISFNSNGTMEEFGMYIGEDKIYFDTTKVVNPYSGEERDTIVKVRYAHKNGLWLYFNDKGQITKEEMWQDKKLIKEIYYRKDD